MINPSGPADRVHNLTGVLKSDYPRGDEAIEKRDRLTLAVGTGLFAGMIPPRSGTLGSLWGVLLAYGYHEVGSIWFALASTVVLCAAGVWVCGRSAQILGREDPREVVFDEIVTMPIVFLGLSTWNWPIAITGFLLHRLFDITKPLGINSLQRFPGGLGIMLDDVAAGLAGMISFQVLIRTGLFERVWGGNLL
ncbi:phosphatidylglycerophosphatase A [bacterium]|nr:phosphatidylglycerophosphatase A [bacterium]